MQRLFLLASALLAPQAYGNGFDWAPKVSESDADASLAVELSGIDDARIADYEAAMRTTVATLPRNEFGRLSHEAVHYVLHRLFVARFGWFFKGLEPNEDESDDSARAKDMILRLQKRLEEPSGNKGFSLHELAVLAAALEDLVHQEASIQLRAAWKASGFETNQSITREEAENVVASYMMIFLAARDISAAKRTDLIEALRKFKKGYTDWEAAEKWLVDLEIKTWGPKTEAPGSFDFSATEKMVQNIGKEFGHFNDMECKALKTTLHELEHRSPKAGRVRLPDFYNKSFYSHWRFNEKVDYLKDMGALDDTNKEQPLVISANYAMARSNCLEATDFFAVCCRNECEDLMGSLEKSIGMERATADGIERVVRTLSSDTVQAPRELPQPLRNRLKDVAASQNGLINLHGRLFAQWMHHAFPNECPYPHEAASNPQTADEWLAKGGVSASAEEMMQHVSNDTGPVPVHHTEKAELPWSHGEQLLNFKAKKVLAKDGSDQIIDVKRVWWLRYVVAALFAVGSGMAFMRSRRLAMIPRKPGQPLLGRQELALAICLIAVAGFLCGLLDQVMLIFSCVGGLLSLVFQHFAPQATGKAKTMEEAAWIEKCCV